VENKNVKRHNSASSVHQFPGRSDFVDSQLDHEHTERKQRKKHNIGRGKKRPSFLAKPASKETMRATAMSSVEAHHIQGTMDRDEKCLAEFNPIKEGVFHKVLATWTEAYVEIATQVAALRPIQRQ